MKKLNQYYKSPFEYLAGVFPIFRKLEQIFYPEYWLPLTKTAARKLGNLSELQSYRRYIPLHDQASAENMPYWKIVGGGLQPFIDIAKDVVDTFKPYKSSYYIGRDFIQPIRGIGNIVKGVANLVAGLIIFLANTVKYLYRFSQDRRSEGLKKNMLLNLARFGGWLLDGISNIIRGATQFFATPLTWGRLIFIRGPLTLCKGYQKIENNRGMQELARTAATGWDRSSVTPETYHMYRKFMKARRRGQLTEFKPSGDLDAPPLTAPIIAGDKTSITENHQFYKGAIKDIGLFMMEKVSTSVPNIQYSPRSPRV